MDLDTYREYPVVGELFFSEPAGGRSSWAFFALTLLFTGFMAVDRGPEVAILAGGGLVLLATPNVLPERYHRPAVLLRFVAVASYGLLWLVILVAFPDAPTFFEGNW